MCNSKRYQKQDCTKMLAFRKHGKQWLARMILLYITFISAVTRNICVKVNSTNSQMKINRLGCNILSKFF